MALGPSQRLAPLTSLPSGVSTRKSETTETTSSERPEPDPEAMVDPEPDPAHDDTDHEEAGLAQEEVPRRAVVCCACTDEADSTNTMPEQAQSEQRRSGDAPERHRRVACRRRRRGGGRRRTGGGASAIVVTILDPSRSQHRARTERAKSSPLSRVALVPVERRAPRREHDHVAAPPRATLPPRPRRPSSGRCGAASSRTRRRPRPPDSPMPTTARTGGASSPRTDRSRPLFRPPAMSTTEGKPLTAAPTAWGTVALESSNHRTPSCSPRSSTRCASPRKPTSAARAASVVPPAACAVATAANALATSWGRERPSSSTRTIDSPPGPTSAPSTSP